MLWTEKKQKKKKRKKEKKKRKEAKDIKKSWQEYTEELHKKDLNDPDNHDGMITHLFWNAKSSGP